MHRLLAYPTLLNFHLSHACLPTCHVLHYRAVPGIYSSAPAVEVSTVYFEDSCAHAGIINMAIRKAMWPMVSIVGSDAVRDNATSH